MCLRASTTPRRGDGTNEVILHGGREKQTERLINAAVRGAGGGVTFLRSFRCLAIDSASQERSPGELLALLSACTAQALTFPSF